jgi:DNA invertase Pin-like site-specific DNA recombinase
VPLGERPAGAELLAALAEGRVQHVLAFKLDRLFRDAVDCLKTCRGWDEAGVAMHLVDLGGQAVNTGSAVGRFFLGMLAGVAELERNLIAERTSAALRHKVARGERVGAPPYGFAAQGDGTEWVPVPAEQAVLRRIRVLRAGGARSLAAVADRLNADGVMTKRGARWHAATVRSVLARMA